MSQGTLDGVAFSLPHRPGEVALGLILTRVTLCNHFQIRTDRVCPIPGTFWVDGLIKIDLEMPTFAALPVDSSHASTSKVDKPVLRLLYPLGVRLLRIMVVHIKAEDLCPACLWGYQLGTIDVLYFTLNVGWDIRDIALG